MEGNWKEKRKKQPKKYFILISGIVGRTKIILSFNCAYYVLNNLLNVKTYIRHSSAHNNIIILFNII